MCRTRVRVQQDRDSSPTRIRVQGQIESPSLEICFKKSNFGGFSEQNLLKLLVVFIFPIILDSTGEWSEWRAHIILTYMVYFGMHAGSFGHGVIINREGLEQRFYM